MMYLIKNSLRHQFQYIIWSTRFDTPTVILFPTRFSFIPSYDYVYIRDSSKPPQYIFVKKGVCMMRVKCLHNISCQCIIYCVIKSKSTIKLLIFARNNRLDGSDKYICTYLQDNHGKNKYTSTYHTIELQNKCMQMYENIVLLVSLTFNSPLEP